MANKGISMRRTAYKTPIASGLHRQLWSVLIDTISLIKMTLNQCSNILYVDPLQGSTCRRILLF